MSLKEDDLELAKDLIAMIKRACKFAIRMNHTLIIIGCDINALFNNVEATLNIICKYLAFIIKP
jgi:hypothetical protein